MIRRPWARLLSVAAGAAAVAGAGLLSANAESPDAVPAALTSVKAKAVSSKPAAPTTATKSAGASHGSREAPPPPTDIIPLSEIKAGMKGYGLTVFQGTHPERFDVRVIGVLHNFLPKQDIILIQSDDPRLLHSGIVAGMSGSPIYFDGRLAGALAYGWNFAKDPIAGVTPIETMLAEMKRPLRGRRWSPAAEASWTEPLVPGARPADSRDTKKTLAEVLSDRDRRQGAPRSPLLAQFPLPPALADGADPRLVRASVPLSLAGFSAGPMSELTDAFKPYHMVPLQAGGASASASGKAEGPARFEPGGSIAVQLVRGDVSAAATGTVTYVAGDKVLGFGHPMFNVGEIYLPIATAEVHTFMSALSSSFKLASPAREAGSLVQDRQSGILGSTAEKADMIPVNVTVGGPNRPEQTYHAEVVRHRFLTPLLAAGVVTNAAQASASDVADATITMRSNLKVRGYQPLELVDHVYSPDGVSSRTLSSASGMKALGEVLFNPFTPATIDAIDVRVDVDYKADVAEIVGVSLNSDELEPGSRPNVYVTLRPYAGKEVVQAIPLEVPRHLAGQNLKLVATAGNLAKPDMAPPENLGGLLENLKKGYPARSIVLSLETPDEGVTLRGAVIPDLPGSVIDTLRPGASTRRADTFKRAARLVVPTRGVVTGKQEITIHIRDEKAP